MNTPIRVLLTQKPADLHTVPNTHTVAEAVDRMNSFRVGALFVEADGRLVGLLSERDVLSRVISAGRDPTCTSVHEVMTTRVATVSSDATVAETLALMQAQGCRHVPVVDGGELIGMISVGDLTRWNLRYQAGRINDLERYITLS